jgi:hypothetical protein
VYERASIFLLPALLYVLYSREYPLVQHVGLGGKTPGGHQLSVWRVCLPVCLFACLPVCLSGWLPVCLSASLPVCLSACLPVLLSLVCPTSQTYAKHAPWPHGHTLAQNVFQSGAIPGDTDFQVDYSAADNMRTVAFTRVDAS